MKEPVGTSPNIRAMNKGNSHDRRGRETDERAAKEMKIREYIDDRRWSLEEHMRERRPMAVRENIARIPAEHREAIKTFVELHPNATAGEHRRAAQDHRNSAQAIEAGRDWDESKHPRDEQGKFS